MKRFNCSRSGEFFRQLDRIIGEIPRKKRIADVGVPANLDRAGKNPSIRAIVHLLRGNTLRSNILLPLDDDSITFHWFFSHLDDITIRSIR